jgi:pentose-5-phosphate-3-epimerase
MSSVARWFGVKLVHVDVIDGVFCPLATFGPPVVRALRDRFVKDAT